MYGAQPIIVMFTAMSMLLLVRQRVDEVPKLHDDA
jgi:hypothetical protein